MDHVGDSVETEADGNHRDKPNRRMNRRDQDQEVFLAFAAITPPNNDGI